MNPSYMGRLIKWKILKDLEKGLCHFFFPAENVLNRRDVLNRSQRFSIPDNLPLKGNPMVSGKKGILWGLGRTEHSWKNVIILAKFCLRFHIQQWLNRMFWLIKESKIKKSPRPKAKKIISYGKQIYMYIYVYM